MPIISKQNRAEEVHRDCFVPAIFTPRTHCASLNVFLNNCTQPFQYNRDVDTRCTSPEPISRGNWRSPNLARRANLPKSLDAGRGPKFGILSRSEHERVATADIGAKAATRKGDDSNGVHYTTSFEASGSSTSMLIFVSTITHSSRINFSRGSSVRRSENNPAIPSVSSKHVRIVKN